jgi:uncharacterized phage protein gp47/JayE
MPDYGLTPTGFNIKRLPEIKADLEANLLLALGKLNLEPDSVTGILIGVQAEAVAELWERLQEIYLAMYPASAEDFSLDNVAQLTGITRSPAIATTVPAAMWGTAGTVLPAGIQVSVEETNEIFSSQQSTTIGAVDYGAGEVTIKQAVALTAYTITINGTDFTVTTIDPPASVENIAGSLALQINILGSEPVTAYSAGALVIIISDDVPETFTLTVNGPSTRIDVTDWGALADFTAVNTGAVLALAGTLTQIKTPVSGLTAVNNYVDGVLGRDAETDIELRTRRLASLTQAGAATVEAIRSHMLQEIADVVNVLVEDNRTDVTVGDLTPHSLRAVVQGGVNADIAEKLWELKPAGIETIGTEEVVVTDSMGQPQTIRFARPTPILVWLDVVLTPNAEEEFPTPEAAGLLAIREAILAMGNLLNVGDNVIIQTFFAAIYSVPGIATASITRATGSSPGAPPYGSSANIAIANDEIATFSLARITVDFA